MSGASARPLPLAAVVAGVAAAWQQYRPWLGGIRRFVPAQPDKRLKLETMTKAVPDQKREINDRGRSHDGPDREADLDSSGLVVFLWLLALLIAEVALWISLFAHMYGP